MKTTAELKHFCKTILGIPVRGNTIAGKQHWQGVRIAPESTPNIHDPLVYKHEFPADFRQLCLQVVYGKDSAVGQQTIGGNIRHHDIAMLPHEWDQVISEYVPKA